MKKIVIILFVSLLLLVSCDTKTTSLKGNTKDFNDSIRIGAIKKEIWVDSPITIVLKFLDAKIGFRFKEQKINITSLSGSENITKVKITVETIGIPDDSTQEESYVFYLSKSDNIWQIDDIEKSMIK